MRYWIGFVVVVALVAAPVVVQGQGAARASGTDAWLQLQLNEPEGLRVLSVSRPSLAYVPEDLKHPVRTSRYDTAAAVEGVTPQSAAATDTADEQKPEAEPYVVEPDLSPMDIRRWHPEAFDPAVKSDRELQFEYVASTPTTEQPRRLSKGARIAIGVIVPVVFVGVVAGAATASAISRMEF